MSRHHPRHCERSEAIHLATRRKNGLLRFARNDGEGCLNRESMLAGVAIARRSVLACEMSDMLLGVELKADAADQVELGLEEIDVMLLVLHQLLEQVA